MNISRAQKTSTMKRLSGGLMTNKWIRCLGLSLLLISTSAPSFAVCESEEDNLVRVSDLVCTENKISCPQYAVKKAAAVNEKNVILQGFVGESVAHTRQQIESIRADLARMARLNSPYDRNTIAGKELALCAYKAKLNSLSASANSKLAESQLQNPTQQPQQPQQNQSTQQQSQQAQQQAQQAQDTARMAQTRADQARQGKRRQHEPENEASHCIQPDFGGLYGGMKNTCDFKVWHTYCGYRPKESSWLTGMSCEKQSFGSDSVGPGRTSASHTKGVESIHWLACKEPAWALDTEFVPGQGIKGRCYTVGGK